MEGRRTSSSAAVSTCRKIRVCFSDVVAESASLLRFTPPTIVRKYKSRLEEMSDSWELLMAVQKAAGTLKSDGNHPDLSFRSK